MNTQISLPADELTILSKVVWMRLEDNLFWCAYLPKFKKFSVISMHIPLEIILVFSWIKINSFWNWSCWVQPVIQGFINILFRFLKRFSWNFTYDDRWDKEDRATFFTLPIFWTDRIYVLVFYKEQKMPGFSHKSLYSCCGINITAKCLSGLIWGLKESFCFKMGGKWYDGRMVSVVC